METDKAVNSSTMESLAMCDYPPVTADSPGNYHLDNGLSTVGQIVTAYCKNTTVAVVRCMPNLQWNATVPPCPIDDRSRDNMSAVLIVLWVVGGVLLIALVVLIVVIIKSRSKTSCGLGRTSSPSTSVFHISGRGNNGRSHRRGGDNPAFSRADEICGEWSYHRGDAFPDSQRLPSYHEAISNSCMTVPVRTRHSSQQDPPAARNSSTSLDGNRHFQSLGINLRLDSSNLSESQIRTARVDTEANSEEQSTQRNQNDEASGPTSVATTEQATPANQLRSSSDQRNAQASRNSRRYAENYPQCFFEDEPPPPYTFQPANYNPNRSAQQQQPRISGHNPSRTRSMPVPSSRSGSNQDENNFQQSRHFRRSMCDRLASAANPRSQSAIHRPDVHMRQSVASSNNNQIYSVQSDTRYNTRSNGQISRLLSNANNVTNGTYPSTELPRDSRPREEQTADHTLANHIQPPLSRLSGLRNAPPDSALPGNNIQQYSASEIVENMHRDLRDHNRTRAPMTQDSIYIIRSYQDTQSAMPYSSFSKPQHHSQSQPLGTSTPVNQSPVGARRFGPADHPSPLPIPRNHAFHQPSQEPPTLHSYGSEI
ncbi:hypothetical protein BsWGS_28727 [Bradybaena similaris]